ncbi:hypothetical protein SMF913_10159 [Streptomyces malaysiensis]|uniref:Uncharacterized protein n=1 Tax=Streptomyces malaysiensis TaxID=92644 RepID=A0A2J7Z1I9_STRMQ|nr:hypothetical protein SMF913_10159 [Streptomyces malaysiensis]
MVVEARRCSLGECGCQGGEAVMFLATVCRVIQRLGPLLVLKPVRRPRQAAGRSVVDRGRTLVPVRDRTRGHVFT